MANFKLTQTKEQIQADLDLLDKNTATAGQVLTANGTGGASWQNASGGSGGGGTRWYEHTIYCSTDDNYITYIVLIDTNASAYTDLTEDFMRSLVANNKYIFYNGTNFFQLFADVAAAPPGQQPQGQTPSTPEPQGPPVPPVPPVGFTLTTYFLQNKSFVSFTINSITSDDVTPL